MAGEFDPGNVDTSGGKIDDWAQGLEERLGALSDSVAPKAESAPIINANAAEYGLTKNVTADQHAALQAAIDEARQRIADGAGSIEVQLLEAGTYTFGLHQVPGIASGYQVAAMFWLDSQIKLKLGENVVIKLKDHATLPSPTTRGVGVTTYGGRQGSWKYDWGIEGGTFDFNGANQDAITDPGGAFNGAIWAGIKAERSIRAKFTRVKVKNVYGTGFSPPDESFCFDEFVSRETTWTSCEVDGTLSSGFSSSYSSGGTWIDCVAHDCTNGFGFPHHKSSNLRFIGCRAWNCTAAAGFNAELCENVSYSGCLSGGRLANAESFGTAAFAPLTKQGNSIGFKIAGSRNVIIADDCQSLYNTSYGVFVAPWTAGTPTLQVPSGIRIKGRHMHNGTSGTGYESSNIYLDPAASTNTSFTGNITSGVATIAVTGGTPKQGQEIIHSSFPFGTTITDVTGSVATVSAPATAPASGATILAFSDVHVQAKTLNNSAATTFETIKSTVGAVVEVDVSGGLQWWAVNNSGSSFGYRWFRDGSGPAGSTLAPSSAGGWPDLAVNANGQVVTAGRKRNVVAVTAASYNVRMVDDLVLVNRAGAVSIQLPQTSVAGTGATEFEIVDSSNLAGTNNITVLRGGTDTFLGGATSKTINTNGGGLRISYDGTGTLIAHPISLA